MLLAERCSDEQFASGIIRWFALYLAFSDVAPDVFALVLGPCASCFSAHQDAVVREQLSEAPHQKALLDAIDIFN